MTKKYCPETGKICYPTSAEAHLALRCLNIKRKNSKYGLNHIYKCPFCNEYHLTRQEKV